MSLPSWKSNFSKLGQSDQIPPHSGTGQETTPCFPANAKALQQGKIALEAYFDTLLTHLVRGGVRHADDASDANLTSLTTMDPVSGAVKVCILDSKFKALEGKGSSHSFCPTHERYTCTDS